MGGASRFHRNISVSQDRNEKRRKGTLLCSRKYLVWKKTLWVGGDVGGEGVSRFPSKFSRLTVSKKIRRGTLLCFKSFLIWQNF